jgi:hypothetical protein
VKTVSELESRVKNYRAKTKKQKDGSACMHASGLYDLMSLQMRFCPFPYFFTAWVVADAVLQLSKSDNLFG